MTDLPEGWEWSTLGEVAKVSYGRGLAKGVRVETSDVPVVGSAGIVGYHDRALVDGPSVVVGRKGNAGAVWTLDRPSWPIDTTYYLIPPRDLLLEFLGLQLSALRLGDLDSSTAIPSLRRHDLESVRLAIAPRAEQERIVAAIEEHLSRLDAADSQLSVLRDRLGSFGPSMVSNSTEDDGWPLVKWGDIGETLSGRAFPSAAYTDAGVRLLRPGNLHRSGEVRWSAKASKYLPASFAEEAPKFLLRGRKLLMNLTAQSLADGFLGRVCLSAPHDEFLLNQRIACLSSPHALDDYLYFVFRSRRFRRFVASLSTGSLIQHMSVKQLAAFEFRLPPIEVQQRTSEALRHQTDMLVRVEEEVEAGRQRTTALRRSILAAAFAGKLVPQDPDDEPAAVLLERIRAARG